MHITQTTQTYSTLRRHKAKVPDHYLDHRTVCVPYLLFILHTIGNIAALSVPPRLLSALL